MTGFKKLASLTSVIAFAMGCALHPQPLSVYEKHQLGEADPMNLAPHLRRCTETLELGQGAHGRVRLHYPRSMPPDRIAKIAQDYANFYPVAIEVLGSSGSADVWVYVLPMEATPRSYTFHLERRGAEWHGRYLTPLVVAHDDDLASAAYWSQLATDVHEMAHVYLDLGLSNCHRNISALRWFEDGVSELVQALYLERYVPGQYDQWLQRNVIAPVVPVVFDDSIFDWTLIDASVATREEYEGEVGRYVVAYQLVRHIHELDAGASLRALRRELHARSPRTRRQLDDVLEATLGMSASVLVQRVRERRAGGS